MKRKGGTQKRVLREHFKKPIVTLIDNKLALSHCAHERLHLPGFCLILSKKQMSTTIGEDFLEQKIFPCYVFQCA